MSETKRLDVILFERGFTDSREKAKNLIKDGVVAVNGAIQRKAGYSVASDDTVELCGDVMPYVSRGGYKLEKAINVFSVNLNGCVCADIGASTGGFTDCMLQNGAAKVYAIDVGSGQLSYKLKADSRVINMEKTNFRHIQTDSICEALDFASVDVSFISLKHILPNLFTLLKYNGEAVCLVKPQFEAGKDNIGKNGVVKDAQIHINVLENVIEFANETGFSVLNLDFSPIKGPSGNIEYLLYITKKENTYSFDCNKINETVDASHIELNRGAY